MSEKAEQPPLPEDQVAAGIIVPPVTEPRLDPKVEPLTSATTPKERRMAFRILMLSIICLGLGQTILFAILPPVARQIGLADIQVGIIFTISAILWVVSSPFWGRRSDKMGRKPVILLGVGSFVISLGGLSLVMEAGLQGMLAAVIVFPLMVFFRSLHGSFVSAGPAAAQAYIADRTEPQERTSSLAGLAAAFGLGASIGPGIGSATAQFGPVVPLYVCTVISILSFIAILMFLPERSQPAQMGERPQLKMRDPRLRRILIYGAGGGILMVIPIQLIGFYLIDVLVLDDVTASQYLGIALMINALAALFSQLVLVQRTALSTRTLLNLTPLLIVTGHVIIALSSNFGTIVFGLMFAGLGAGMFMPAYNGAVSLSVKPEEQGAAAGIANSAAAIGFIIAPIFAFTLYRYAPQIPFYCSSLIALGLLAYSWFALKRDWEKRTG